MALELEILSELRAIRELLSAKAGSDRLTREEAAMALNVSVRTFDRIVSSGAIKRDQETGPIRFRGSDVANYKAGITAVFRPRRKYTRKETAA
jgi:hypothetical protein